MLDEEQRSMIMKLYGKGVNISEIARKVGVSRHSVYRVIHSDIEEDRDVHELKKQLRKTELEKRIWDLKMPMRKQMKKIEMEKVIDNLFSRVLGLWGISPEHGDTPPACIYCGKEMEYFEKVKGSVIDVQGFRCHGCKKVFYLS